jgi:alpha-L-fucosidase
VSLREFLPLGQRIDRWAVDVWRGDAWVEIGAGEAIGARRLVWTDPVTTDRVRLRVVVARAAPAISEFAIHLGPMRPEP